jgi:hypothetical protein
VTAVPSETRRRSKGNCLQQSSGSLLRHTVRVHWHCTRCAVVICDAKLGRNGYCENRRGQNNVIVFSYNYWGEQYSNIAIHQYSNTASVLINDILRRVRVTIFVVDKQCVTYSRCVSVALRIRHAMSMRHLTLSFVASLAVPDFTSLFHKGYDFLKKATEYKMCVLIFCAAFCVWNSCHWKKNWTRRCHKCMCMCTACCSWHVLMKLEFYWQMVEKYSDTKFNGNRNSCACVRTDRQTDRQTDMT